MRKNGGSLVEVPLANGQAGDQGRPATDDGVTVGVVDSAGVEEVGDALVEVGQRNEADDHDDEGEGEGDQNTLLTTGELDLLVDLGSSLAVSFFGVLELLHRQDGRTLVSLDLLGIAHHEDDGHSGSDNPQDGTEADDDGLVDLNANAGQSVDGSADGERVNRGARAAAASAEQDGSGADHRVEASGHHGSGEQGVEGNGLLAHTISGTTEEKMNISTGMSIISLPLSFCTRTAMPLSRAPVSVIMPRKPPRS